MDKLYIVCLCMCACVLVCACIDLYAYFAIVYQLKETYYAAQVCMSLSLCGRSLRIFKGKFTTKSLRGKDRAK